MAYVRVQEALHEQRESKNIKMVVPTSRRLSADGRDA
jgi:hypothetical protein